MWSKCLKTRVPIYKYYYQILVKSPFNVFPLHEFYMLLKVTVTGCKIKPRFCKSKLSHFSLLSLSAIPSRGTFQENMFLSGQKYKWGPEEQ